MFRQWTNVHFGAYIPRVIQTFSFHSITLIYPCMTPPLEWKCGGENGRNPSTGSFCPVKCMSAYPGKQDFHTVESSGLGEDVRLPPRLSIKCALCEYFLPRTLEIIPLIISPAAMLNGE
jgi:hypothetical protein